MTDQHGKRRFETHAIHGREEDRPYPYRSVTPPIIRSSTFGFESLAALHAEQEKPMDGIVYSRWHNPTVRDAEHRLALLEESDEAALFGAGISAIAAGVLSCVNSGERLISFRDIYGGAVNLFTGMLPRLGITVDWVDTNDYEALEAAIRPETKALYFESPTNPVMKIVDMERMAEVGRRHGLALIFDNTMATPYLQRPLQHGVDIAVYSATKYLCGHSDMILGAATGNRERMLHVHGVRTSLGLIADPESAWLFSRSLATLSPRMERHCDNGEAVAAFLREHPAVARVYYPGFTEGAERELVLGQMRRFGGMMSFDLKDGGDKADRFVDALEMIALGASLGGIESLVAEPRYATHRKMERGARERLGIGEGMIRLSVGIENVDDIIADLTQALEA
jgi:cystathionine beta-lyase/cystathionine gamma-synthase